MCHMGNEDYRINWTIHEYFKIWWQIFLMLTTQDWEYVIGFKTPLGTWEIRQNSHVAKIAMLGHFWPLLHFRKSSTRVPKPLSIFKLLFWNHFSRENVITKTWAVSSNIHSKFLDKRKKYIFFSRNIKNSQF